MDEKQKMIAGLEYFPSNKALQADRLRAKTVCHQANQLSPSEKKQAMRLLKSLFKQTKGFWIEPQFYCDYGYNITLGNNFYANHNVVILDAAAVTIGDDVLLGPGVILSTATHPMDIEKRRKGIESASPITLGNDVWVGMGAKILPGVTVGDGAVIGAGAVVSKDVPAQTTVVGIPAKPHER